MPKELLEDEEILLDMLYTQQYLTDAYNTGMHFCTTPQMKSQIIEILSEEQQMQDQLLDEMLKRGYMVPKEADTLSLLLAREKNQKP